MLIKLKKQQDKLRKKVLKYFLSLYSDAVNWSKLLSNKALENNSSLKNEIKNGDGNSISTFQKGLYERIINTIFKSIKF